MSRSEASACIADWMPGTGAENYIASSTIEARKARGTTRIFDRFARWHALRAAIDVATLVATVSALVATL